MDLPCRQTVPVQHSYRERKLKYVLQVNEWTVSFFIGNNSIFSKACYRCSPLQQWSESMTRPSNLRARASGRHGFLI